MELETEPPSSAPLRTSEQTEQPPPGRIEEHLEHIQERQQKLEDNYYFYYYFYLYHYDYDYDYTYYYHCYYDY